MGQHRPWHALDERVLERLYAGDDEGAARAALVELRRRHDEELCAQARRQCGGSAGLRQEAMQRLDTKLLEKRNHYDPEKGKGIWIAWTRTLLWHIIIDLFRERGRFPNTSPGDWMDQTPGPGPPPDEETRREELEQAMAECLQRLPPEQREALTLRALDGRSYEEIGEQTGVPWGTAATRVRLAKEKMQAWLRPKGYEGGEL
jgi:RNA polymerase sigma-70 factor (ECF subfamily)